MAIKNLIVVIKKILVVGLFRLKLIIDRSLRTYHEIRQTDVTIFECAIDILLFRTVVGSNFYQTFLDTNIFNKHKNCYILLL